MIRFPFPLRDGEPTAGTPPNPPPPEPTAPPPAAKIVVSTEKTERELQLERELESERERAKRAETLAAEKTDEFHRYKQSVESPRPMPTAAEEDSGWFFKRG